MRISRILMAACPLMTACGNGAPDCEVGPPLNPWVHVWAHDGQTLDCAAVAKNFRVARTVLLDEGVITASQFDLAMNQQRVFIHVDPVLVAPGIGGMVAFPSGDMHLPGLMYSTAHEILHVVEVHSGPVGAVESVSHSGWDKKGYHTASKVFECLYVPASVGCPPLHAPL